MKVITVRNVNSALYEGIKFIQQHGVLVESRNGPALEVQEPVATVYRRPWEKVLLNADRDANPFFHLMEAMWILAGREDVRFLTEFNSRMADYSDNGVTFNAPYGHRMRHHYDHTGFKTDQIQAVIQVLKDDPSSRQAVIQIWDTNDLEKTTKDKACNMSVVFKIRNSHLDMTVYNRSNDMIWGAYGANAVQFAVLQEYVAAHLGLPIGHYTQITNSYHVYTTGVAGELYEKLKSQVGFNQGYDFIKADEIELIGYSPIGAFDRDLVKFFKLYDLSGLYRLSLEDEWESDYFKKLVSPMLKVWCYRKFAHDKAEGLTGAINLALDEIGSADWKAAAYTWLRVRLEKLV